MAPWKKGGFLSILLETLSASLLVNLLTDKGTIRAGESTIKADEGMIRAARIFNTALSSYPLTNFEMHKYYPNKHLIAFIQEIIYLIEWSICNKFLWV